MGEGWTEGVMGVVFLILRHPDFDRRESVERLHHGWPF